MIRILIAKYHLWRAGRLQERGQYHITRARATIKAIEESI